MRHTVCSVILIGVLLFGSFLVAQDNPAEIKVNVSTAKFDKISESNYDLHIRWQPYIGATRYTIKYSDKAEDIKNPEDLESKITTATDTTGITLSLNRNVCYFQVEAVDTAMSPVAESKVYRATMSFTEAKPLSGVDVVFIRAIRGSFAQMDPIAGWVIVAVILMLLIYGIIMGRSIRRATKTQNHMDNQDLHRKMEDFLAKWREHPNDQDQLLQLLADIKEFNKDDTYSLLTIISTALEKAIENLRTGNGSKDGLEYELENCIDYQLEDLKIGSYSKYARFISLARIKMLGETAPMLGLLGTVSGLIVAFFNILESSRGGADYQTLLAELSSGIYSAIVTTIIGLLIGIALLFIHHGVEVRVKRLQHAWHKKYLEIKQILD